jgi:hypothetical protein
MYVCISVALRANMGLDLILEISRTHTTTTTVDRTLLDECSARRRDLYQQYIYICIIYM